jgi:hypothetical protein
MPGGRRSRGELRGHNTFIALTKSASRLSVFRGWGDTAMPFSKHQIDPTHIEAMRAAFKKVCDTLLLKCGADDPMTEIIVTKIVALAEAGEHDADRLAELVLNDVVDDGRAAAS